jgi:hypothetical protein
MTKQRIADISRFAVTCLFCGFETDVPHYVARRVVAGNEEELALPSLVRCNSCTREGIYLPDEIFERDSGRAAVGAGSGW